VELVAFMVLLSAFFLGRVFESYLISQPTGYNFKKNLHIENSHEIIGYGNMLLAYLSFYFPTQRAKPKIVNIFTI
jgi:hypothetical protein